MQEPIEELISKMRDLYSRGYVPAKGTGSGRYGLALERELGIASNSSKKPDFKGIELKTKAGATLQTLFSRTPSRYTGCSDKLDLTLSHGYEKKGRQQLYTSMNSEGDSLGFSIIAMEDYVKVVREGKELLQYDIQRLEAALLSKHKESAFINVETNKTVTGDGCRFDELLYCKSPSIGRFMDLLQSGSIFLDFTLSIKNGTARDHGFLWRIKGNLLPSLYETSQVYKLN